MHVSTRGLLLDVGISASTEICSELRSNHGKSIFRPLLENSLQAEERKKFVLNLFSRSVRRFFQNRRVAKIISGLSKIARIALLRIGSATVLSSTTSSSSTSTLSC